MSCLVVPAPDREGLGGIEGIAVLMLAVESTKRNQVSYDARVVSGIGPPSKADNGQCYRNGSNGMVEKIISTPFGDSVDAAFTANGSVTNRRVYRRTQ